MNSEYQTPPPLIQTLLQVDTYAQRPSATYVNMQIVEWTERQTDER